MENRSKGRSCLGTIIALFGIAVSIFWLLNLTAGIFELPDNLPIIGNLDEAFFTMVLLASLAYLDIELPFLSRRSGRFAQTSYKRNYLPDNKDNAQGKSDSSKKLQ
jgi:hypothetical protein